MNKQNLNQLASIFTQKTQQLDSVIAKIGIWQLTIY
jgi:hypothetical protein